MLVGECWIHPGAWVPDVRPFPRHLSPPADGAPSALRSRYRNGVHFPNHNPQRAHAEGNRRGDPEPRLFCKVEAFCGKGSERSVLELLCDPGHRWAKPALRLCPVVVSLKHLSTSVSAQGHTKVKLPW